MTGNYNTLVLIEPQIFVGAQGLAPPTLINNAKNADFPDDDVKSVCIGIIRLSNSAPSAPVRFFNHSDTTEFDMKNQESI